MKLLRYKRILLFLLLPASLLAAQLAKQAPPAVDRWYSCGLYRLLSASVGRFFSLFPFSMAEILLLVLCLALMAGLVWFGLRMVRDPGRIQLLGRLGSTVLAGAGVVYFLFMLCCGFNYHRLEFAVHSGLAVRESSAEELAALCMLLTEQANGLRQQLEEDGEGAMLLTCSFRELAGAAPAAYDKVSADYPVLGGYTPRAKGVLLSRGMSWFNISGIYIPFTFEANVNTDIPDHHIPSSMMHELAHSKGFMREDEANFISYLACLASDDPQIRYSGVMLALGYVRSALYSADRDAYYEASESLSEAVQRDFTANSLYWRQFEGPAAEVSTAVNNVYLKSNNQQSGVKSYGRMVDLLLAEYRQRYGPE